MALKYQFDEESGLIKADEKGNPVVVDDEKEESFGLDAIHLYSKIPALQEESKSHRLKAKEAQEKLSAYEGIEDPEAAREALEKVKNLKEGDLKKAEDVERLKKETEEAYKSKIDETVKGYEAKLKEWQDTVSAKDQQIYKLTVSNKFAASPWFSGEDKKTILTPDIAEAYFGRHFQIEDGQMVAYDHQGNKLYSRERPGEPASFDEAISWIIDQYPQKDAILKGQQGGSGERGYSVGGGRISVKTRKDLKTDADKAKFVSEYGQDAYKKLPKE